EGAWKISPVEVVYLGAAGRSTGPAGDSLRLRPVARRRGAQTAIGRLYRLSADGRIRGLQVGRSGERNRPRRLPGPRPTPLRRCGEGARQAEEGRRRAACP